MAESTYLSGFDTYSIPSAATLIEQAVYKLRTAIMRGTLRPGQKLVEASLCKTLEISRASLREALRALQAEKLIELVPNRGPSVARLGFREVEEIHEVWALLTGQAVADFTRLAKRADIAGLDDALKKLAEHNRTGAPLGQLAAINTFFGLILRKCGNTVLIDMITSLVARVNFLRAQALLQEGWGAVYAKEINEILARIKKADADGARVATRSHISTTCAAAKQLAAIQAPEIGPLGARSPANPPNSTKSPRRRSGARSTTRSR